jgi:hypothetical protein
MKHSGVIKEKGDVMTIQWVDNIITSANTPDVSGYAIVKNGVVESLPIPSEFNKEIDELLSRLSAGQKAIGAIEKMKELYTNDAYQSAATNCIAYHTHNIIAEYQEGNG